MRALAALLACCAGSVAAETVVPVRTIRAQETISAGDLRVTENDIAGTYGSIDDIIGLEARVALYAGRPVRVGNVGPPAIIERNQVVRLSYLQGGLEITTDGRALDRAGAGDLVRVMNLVSRATVTGRVLPDGTVSVSQ